MSAPSLRKLVSTSLLLSAFFLLFLFTAGAFLFSAGARNPAAGLGVAGMAVVGVLAIKELSVRARDTELALAEGERYIEAVADLSQDIHAIISAGSRTFLFLNAAATNLLGYAQEDFTKGGLVFFNSLVHPEDLPVLQDQFEKLLAPGSGAPDAPGVQDQIFRIRDQRGVYRWFRTRMTVFVRSASGQPTEILAVIHDVTQERSFETALIQAQKQESLRTMARGALHDLNNTLMGIQGFTEIAQANPGDPARLRASLEGVQDSLLRANALCRQMMTFTGNGRIQIASRQLNDTVRDCLPAIEGLIPQGCQLDLDLEDDLPLAGLDPNQARCALLNLVYNAAETLRVCGGEIALRTRVKHLGAQEFPGHEGPWVSLEVRNTGPGKSREVVDQVFDPLFPAKCPGNGLGLSTVQGIMAEHQGLVRMVSSPGSGDATTLYFPLAEQAPRLDPGDGGAPAAGAAGGILLVDDEPTIRSILRQGLEMAGFRVIEASDGVDGFGAFVRHRASISLVLLDLTMPRMGGDQVFQEIHKVAPEMPVVLMSGYSEQEATSALSSRGLAGFLPKPCSIREALAVVRKVLGVDGADA